MTRHHYTPMGTARIRLTAVSVSEEGGGGAAHKSRETPTAWHVYSSFDQKRTPNWYQPVSGLEEPISRELHPQTVVVHVWTSRS
jgi:hypothetical protein